MGEIIHFPVAKRPPEAQVVSTSETATKPDEIRSNPIAPVASRPPRAGADWRRARRTLTQKLVNDIEPPETGKERIADGDVKGLYLRILPSGSKTFVLRYMIGARRGEVVIGDARSITLAAARAKAMAVLSDIVVRDVDPVAARQEKIRAYKEQNRETFKALVERYLVDADLRKRPSTVRYERWVIERHIIPRIGTVRYTELRRAQIIGMIESIGATGAISTANHAHALTRHILNYAVKRELLDANPALNIERLYPVATCDRTLTADEVGKLWRFLEDARLGRGKGLAPGQEEGQRAINAVSPSVAIALQLCLLTLQRAGEVAGARAEEFSWSEKLWVIPAERMKSKRAHAVPLSDLALKRFREAFRRSKGALAFPDRWADEPLDPRRLTRALRRVCEVSGITRISAHDLRRTGRTMLTSERVGVSYEVAERVIAHLVGSAVSRVYDRNEYLREKRAALEAWAMEMQHIAKQPRP